LSAADWGHAPCWIDAGGVYKDLIGQGPELPDVVLCLDPWAAQLFDEEAPSGARWFLVSDLKSRKSLSHEDYWAQLEEWFDRRPFAGIIDQEAWEEAIGIGPAEAQVDRAASIHLERPGAWQWKTITGSSEPMPGEQQTLLFLVKYSGSLPHLRVFLDSLARQEYPNDLLRATILTSEKSEDLRQYLRWYALAHPKLTAEPVSTSDTGGGPWESVLNRTLEAVPGALIILSGDHTILPTQFARVALEMSSTAVRPSIVGLSLSAEASAQVLTGNLDAVAHYETLVGAFAPRSSVPLAEEVRLVPPNAWMEGDLGPLANIMDYLRKAEDADAQRPVGPGLLRLGDLA